MNRFTSELRCQLIYNASMSYLVEPKIVWLRTAWQKKMKIMQHEDNKCCFTVDCKPCSGLPFRNVTIVNISFLMMSALLMGTCTDLFTPTAVDGDGHFEDGFQSCIASTCTCKAKLEAGTSWPLCFIMVKTHQMQVILLITTKYLYMSTDRCGK